MGLRQFLTTESSLKVTALNFMLRSDFVFELFTFLSGHFDYAEKRLDEIAMVNFKIYDFTY